MKKKIVFVSMMIAIYLIGVLSGVLLVGHFATKQGFILPPPAGKLRRTIEQHMVNKFTKKLKLTDEQKKQVIQIFSNNIAIVDKYRDEFSNKFGKTIDAMIENVKSVLTEEQKKIFDKMLEEGPRGPGFPPGRMPNMGHGNNRKFSPDKNK